MVGHGGYDRRPLQARRGHPTLREVHGAEIIDIYPPPKPLRPALPRSRRARRVTVAAVAFVALLAGLVFAGAVLVHPLPVLQGEMGDALQPGEYVLTDSVFPALFGYGRGDIVMVRLPGTPPAGPMFPYRVVGLPGETIDLHGGHVLVDGHRLSEPYVPSGEPTDPEPVSGQAHWVVPPGSLFVLGDERAFAADSRVYGPVPLGDVVGRAWLRCWPLGSLEFVSVP